MAKTKPLSKNIKTSKRGPSKLKLFLLGAFIVGALILASIVNSANTTAKNAEAAQLNDSGGYGTPKPKTAKPTVKATERKTVKTTKPAAKTTNKTTTSTAKTTVAKTTTSKPNQTGDYVNCKEKYPGRAMVTCRLEYKCNPSTTFTSGMISDDPAHTVDSTNDLCKGHWFDIAFKDENPNKEEYYCCVTTW